MRTHLSLIFISFVMMGCVIGPSLSPTASSDEVNKALLMQQQDGLSNVFLRRIDGGLGSLPFKVNNVEIGVLANDTYLSIKMSPGHYTISDAYGVVPKMKISVGKGDNILVECIFTPSGFTQSDKDDIPSEAINFTASMDTVSRPGHCWVIKNNVDLIRKRLEDDDLLQANKTVFYPDGYKEYPIAKRINTIASYQNFVNAHPNSHYARDAKQRIAAIHKDNEDRIHEKWKKLALEQKCKLKHKEWVYIDASCKGNYADGQGRAVYNDRQHSFKGTISNGIFVTGKYLKNGVLLFDGSFKDGEPDGKGICIYKDEPEECKYYSGKRVDGLYKQRQQITAMEQRQKQEMDKLRGEIKSIKNNKTYAGSGRKSKTIEDKLLDSAIDKGMDKVFDHLF